MAPKKCSLWASCPKGSKSPGFKNLELSLTLVFILVCVLMCKVALRMQESARRSQCVAFNPPLYHRPMRLASLPRHHRPTSAYIQPLDDPSVGTRAFTPLPPEPSCSPCNACRTKHVFFQSKKLEMVENVMRSLIVGLPLRGVAGLDATALQTTRFQGFRTVSNPVAIVFDSLGLKLTSGKVVLDGVTGMFQQAQLIAIMGPSGCGKVNPPTVPMPAATF